MKKGSAPGRPLTGELSLPGDKSVSHRALIFGALAEGRTGITGLGFGADVKSTRDCLLKLGVEIDSHEARGGRAQDLVVTVEGRGAAGFKAPAGPLDCGNSGTTIRLLMGVLAGLPLSARMEGDASLCRRPMGRVAKPLREMGAAIELTGADKAPLTVKGGGLKGIHFTSPVASAQLKSAVLLAGLLAKGETSVTEPELSRDHTERMLSHFGAPAKRDGLTVTVAGGTRLKAAPVRVPGDISSAAFWVVAATLVQGSELNLIEVGANPTRTGFLDVLDRMGAHIERRLWTEGLIGAVEPIFDLTARFSPLKNADIEPGEVPGLIDEVPILALAATQAKGVSRFKGLAELRHKESDRLTVLAELLTSFGAKAIVEGDDLIISGPTPLTGVSVSAHADHRLAMTALVAGLIAKGETSVSDAECIDISYPSFYEELKKFSGV